MYILDGDANYTDVFTYNLCKFNHYNQNITKIFKKIPFYKYADI
jgi:hypothetical protein